jgi:tRNA pseudouridine38-40 synthase
MGVRNIKLTIAYDGTEYHGWQIQPGFATIQGALTEALEGLLGRKVRICGASRTDAGVSALGQAGLIQIDSPIPTENLAKAITDRLPPDMAVVEAVEVPMGFDVIGAVKSKWYRYTIYNGPVRPVLHIRRCWHIPAKLNIAAMDSAAKFLVGTKDFKSFAAGDEKREDTVRTIFRCDVTGDNSWIYVDVEGNSFLYNMVRNIVGTLVEVGNGRWRPEKINEILEAKDRTAAGPMAPAAGLCLMRVQY